jgi:hypothetical protein
VPAEFRELALAPCQQALRLAIRAIIVVNERSESSQPFAQSGVSWLSACLETKRNTPFSPST